MLDAIMKVSVLSAAVLLTACAWRPQPVEAKKALADAIENNSTLVVPRSVTSALHRSGDSRLTAPAEKRRFRIDARDIDAKEFFTSLVGQSRYSFVVHPDVSGTITLSLRNVTLSDVLNAVADTYGYDIQRRGGIIYVYPSRSTTSFSRGRATPASTSRRAASRMTTVTAPRHHRPPRPRHPAPTATAPEPT